MHPTLAKILSDWEKNQDMVFLLDNNKEFHSFFAGADIPSISATLNPEDRKALQDIMDALSLHIAELTKEAQDIQGKIDSSRKAMEACLSYGSVSRSKRKEK